MTEHQWFSREVHYQYRDYRGDEYDVVCEVSGRIENGHHVPCAGKVRVWAESGRAELFELRSPRMTPRSALSDQLIVADCNLQSYFELMAFAMKALGDLMVEEINTYWMNFPDDSEKPGVWVSACLEKSPQENCGENPGAFQ